MKHRYEFDETGGYDCMTGAFLITDSDGNTVVEVDLRNFGQDNCGDITDEVKAKAERVASIIVDALDAAPNEGDK